MRTPPPLRTHAFFSRRCRTVGGVAALAVGLLASAAFAGSVAAEGFVADINEQRASRGIRVLGVAGDLASFARAHSERMAERETIFHSDNSEFNSLSNWSMIGENVGMGDSVEALNEAFMNSADHRANILHSRFNQVGVGAVSRDGVIYVTEVFAARTTRPARSRQQRVTPPQRRPALPVARRPEPVAPSRNVDMLLRVLALSDVDAANRLAAAPRRLAAP